RTDRDRYHAGPGVELVVGFTVQLAQQYARRDRRMTAECDFRRGTVIPHCPVEARIGNNERGFRKADVRGDPLHLGGCRELVPDPYARRTAAVRRRSEEHTSEL